MDKDNYTLDEITSLYYDAIYAYCRRRIFDEEAAQDITQDVFTKLIENKNINLDTIQQWLYVVAHNKIITYYMQRKKKNQYMSDLDSFEDSIELSYTIDEAFSECNTSDTKHRILENLSEKELELYTDFFEQNKKYEDLSVKYKTSVGTLRVRVNRLRRKITLIIEKTL